ncbi:carbohydrate ABC transporter permease [Breznakiella homolactica]|uniref:Carbohydrate ABC transporter permease n=1 Tax=Breznakiella homolactica TaxID=2798577 RepID=A0A7T8B9I1_9SPIR|nr:carbohydrate ABC transporter permease [Breznakiella homolactica]QQO08477.1 carbohydrate ABC transporter permease [Breznakiella homolactica]
MKKRTNIICSILLFLAALLYLSPFYVVIVNSFKNRAEISLNPLGLPKTLTFEYYQTAMQKMNFGSALTNSLFVTVLSIVFIIILTSATAWIMVRRPSKIGSVVFYIFIATMIIPFQSIMMPLMQFMGILKNTTGIPFLNSHFGLIYMNIGFGVGMCVFLYHGFIKSIPVSIEEAATIDGCNTWQLFLRIVFPMLKTTTVTAMILQVIHIWNDFLLPSLVLSSKDLRTIPLSTYSFFGEYTIQWNLAMAGLTLTILPVIIFYIAAQKYIVAGVSSGAIKQ